MSWLKVVASWVFPMPPQSSDILPSLLIQAVWLFGIYGCHRIWQRFFDQFVDGASMNMDNLIVDSLLHNKLSLLVRARKVLYAFSIALWIASRLKCLNPKMLEFAPYLRCRFALSKLLLCKFAVQVWGTETVIAHTTLELEPDDEPHAHSHIHARPPWSTK